MAGDGPPLVVLSGLSPDAGVGPGPMRRMHESALRPWTKTRRVFYLNRRPELPPGMTMTELVADHAAGAATRRSPNPSMSWASRREAASPSSWRPTTRTVVNRLVLISTGCRLSAATALAQRQVAARIRAGAYRQAVALMAADVVPRRRGRLLAALVASAVWPRLVSRQHLQDMATTIEAEDTFDLANCPPIACPTLLVAGGRDRFYDRALIEETAALIPDCRLSWHPSSRAHHGRQQPAGDRGGSRLPRVSPRC